MCVLAPLPQNTCGMYTVRARTHTASTFSPLDVDESDQMHALVLSLLHQHVDPVSVCVRGGTYVSTCVNMMWGKWLWCDMGSCGIMGGGVCVWCGRAQSGTMAAAAATAIATAAAGRWLSTPLPQTQAELQQPLAPTHRPAPSPAPCNSCTHTHTHTGCVRTHQHPNPLQAHRSSTNPSPAAPTHQPLSRRMARRDLRWRSVPATTPGMPAMDSRKMMRCGDNNTGQAVRQAGSNGCRQGDAGDGLRSAGQVAFKDFGFAVVLAPPLVYFYFWTPGMDSSKMMHCSEEEHNDNNELQ